MAGKVKRVRKVCGKCGRTAPALPRQRRCRLKNGPGALSGYWCYGPLTAVARTTEKAEDRPQDVARKKLVSAERMVAKKRRAMVRLAKSIQVWERRCQVLRRQALQTDEDLAAARVRREQQAQERAARRRRRGIALDGVLS